MNSQLKIYEKLIAECNKEIEINGLRSPNYEFWLKGKRASYEKTINLINKDYDKDTIKVIVFELIEQLEAITLVNNGSNIYTSYLKGKIEGYQFILKHLNN